jgi:hypothetical protein
MEFGKKYGVTFDSSEDDGVVVLKYKFKPTIIDQSLPGNIIIHNTIFLNYSDSSNQEIDDIPMTNEAFVLCHSPHY